MSDIIGRILVIDDDKQVPKLIRSVLGHLGHQVEYAASVKEAQKAMESFAPDLILLDYEMPDKNGLQFLSEIRAQPKHQLLPVIIITGHALPGLKLSAIKEGVTDFLNKPFSHDELVARVQSLLKQKFLTDELEIAEDVLISIAETIDARDHYTCGHGARVAHYSELLGKHAGLGARSLSALKKGCFFHDIGKIGIRDNVLLNPGRLTVEEFRHIQTHPVKGFELLKGLKTLHDALPIIRHHHEKLDGSGYPDGLSGDAIPILVRVASIADIYDALTTDRPYRRALSAKEAFQLMDSEAKKGWWDQDILGEFQDILKKIPSNIIQSKTFSSYEDRAAAVCSL